MNPFSKQPNSPQPKPLSLATKLKLLLSANSTFKYITQPNMKLKGSWKTSLFGATGLVTLVYNVSSMLMDGDPMTNPDWSVVLPLALSGIAALFAKDANVSNAPMPMPTAAKVE